MGETIICGALSLKDRTRIEIGEEVPTKDKSRMRTDLRNTCKNVVDGLFCKPKWIMKHLFIFRPVGVGLYSKTSH